MLSVACTQCGLVIQVPRSVEGARGTCLGCGAEITVPRASKSLQDSDLEFTSGTRVADRYEILDHIGKGGMGAVYAAQDHLIGERVALKFMRPRLLRTQKGQQLFLREAQMARRLRHDHIVAVHDVGRTAEGILYLSMEHLEGRSLRAMLRRHREQRRLIAVRLVVRLLSQTLDALAYAHRFVVHRDIKPENVMVQAGEHVKVLDFGLAKAVDAEASDAAKPAASQRVMGTAAYASPEQKRHGTVDLRSDLYSVGLLCHELLTLRTPLDEPVQVADVRGDVSPSLLSVLERSLHEDKESRWQSAGRFREALSEAYRLSYERARPLAIPTRSGRQASTEDMVFLEGGSFLMGSNDDPQASPQVECEVGPFYMDVYPVTVRQYAEFLEDTGRAEPRFWGDPDFSGDDQPVVGLTWDDALAYAQWAGKQLPTESQWEFAARGRENRTYPWGAREPDPTKANYGDHFNMPSIVGMHEDGMTPDGIHDLAGNVYEWTCDWFAPYSEREGDGGTPPQDPRRVVRGGSWHSGPGHLGCTHRRGLFPETQDATVGLRCVLPVEQGQGGQ